MCIGREDSHYATIAVFKKMLEESGGKHGGGYQIGGIDEGSERRGKSVRQGQDTPRHHLHSFFLKVMRIVGGIKLQSKRAKALDCCRCGGDRCVWCLMGRFAVRR
jgi:hypothetical protein